ncbi:MAG: PDZ domain-containing protein, partial [Planctomycetaceae bacterium]|nr:PDZ domain-containing protein [Planctomycetaceae bacterium]
VNVGVGYAVFANQVQYFLGDFKSGRIVDHSTLNAIVTNDKSAVVKFEDVYGTSDAFRSGLRYNDELVRFAGKPIPAANTFKNLLGIFPPGWRLPVTVRGKDGKRFDLFVRTSGLHTEAELLELTQKMIEPPIIPPEFKKMLEEQQKRLKEQKSGEDTELPDILKGYKEVEIPGPDGKPIKVLQKEHQISDVAKPFYEKRRGYANYFFNRIEAKRVLNNWQKTLPAALVSNADKTNFDWKFTGGIKNRRDTFSFSITNKGVQYELPAEKGLWDAYQMKQETATVLDPLMHYQAPRGSGGLFTSLFLMGQLAIKNLGLDEAEVLYTGTAPLDGNTNYLYDIITISWFGNETRFYFDPQTGLLQQIEMFGSSLDSPGELRFRYAEGKTSIEVRYGSILYGTFEPENAVFVEPPIADSTEEKKPPQRTTPPMLAAALEKTVKIYGAEALSAGGAGIHGYQTGIIVSPDGFILTAITPSLLADKLTIVLNSGRRYEAKIASASPELELALLKIPADDLPFFTLDANVDAVRLGEPVYAATNCFNIAAENEPVSVQFGRVAARTMLHARRGVFETPYRGEIFALDFTVNNPGACGGALIAARAGDLRAAGDNPPILLGIIGKELRNRENNSWFNFAIPVSVFRDRVNEMIQQMKDADNKPQLIKVEAVKPELELIPEDTLNVFQEWGILLIPNVGRRTPPFIDSIRKGSAAEAVKLQPDDLIVMINNRLTASLAAVEYYLHQAKSGEKVSLTIEREQKLFDVQFVKP